MPDTEVCLAAVTAGGEPFVFGTGSDHPTDTNWILTGGTHTLTICPEPFTEEELQENPYKERVSTIDFIVATANSSRKHTVTLRHINYHIELGEMASSYRIGKTYEIDIFNNVDDWRVTTLDIHGAFKTDVVAHTDRNTVTVQMNDDPKKADWIGGFFLHSEKAGVGGTTGRSLYANMRSYHTFPSCFMVRPGESLDIPVTNIQSFWRDWLNNPILTENNITDNYTSLSFKVLWQTSSQPMVSPVSDLEIWYLNNYADARDYRNKKVSVQIDPNSENGSAILAAYHNNRIVWSWHLWITDYDPNTEYVEYTHSGSTTVTFMTRNLGATVTTARNINSVGFYYQWGRKDPYPNPGSYAFSNGSRAIRAIYDGNGTQITGIDGNYIANSQADPMENLERTVTDPLIFMYNNTGNLDWYSSDDNIRNDYLWIDEEGEKTLFDPCPEGWRVPYMKNGRSPWFNVSTINPSNDVYNWEGEVGAFNTAGYRQESGNFNSYSFLHTWMAQTSGSRVNGFRAANGVNGTNTYYRSCGMVIRCIKDD